MSSTSKGSRQGMLSLPNELLIKVFQQCDDFSSVWSLMHTSSLLLSIFNERASDIVNILFDNVPLQTRILMRQVFAIHTGSFSCHDYIDAMRGRVDRSILSSELVATPEQLRNIVGVSHRIHVLAHLCIEDCIQNCLDRDVLLGQRELPIGFKHPTWIEEQRTILALWSLYFANELKKEGFNGHLDWPSRHLKALKSHNVHHELKPHSRYYQAVTALLFILKQTSSDPGQDRCERRDSRLIRFPRLPEGTEFGWTCQPPPSPSAITPPSVIELKPTPSIWSSEIENPSDSSSSEESESEESVNEEPEDEESESESESESERYSFRRYIPRPSPRNTSPPKPPPPFSNPRLAERLNIQDVQIELYIQPSEQDPPKQEWQDLNEETFGVGIWRTMRSRNFFFKGFMDFEPYAKYGLAIWEEQRVMELGLWSRDPLLDARECFQRWYILLAENDVRDYENTIEEYNSDDDTFKGYICGRGIPNRRWWY